jgi:hypothetical protein
MLGHPDISSSDQIGRTRSPSALRSLELGALLQAIDDLHLDGLLTDSECRTKRRRLTASF